MQVLIWRQDMRWDGYDVLRSNTGRTFYQRLDVHASVVGVWWSLVQFFCFVGDCSTAPGWWDINRVSLDFLTMTRVVYSRPPARDSYSVRHLSLTSVSDSRRLLTRHRSADRERSVESLLTLGFFASLYCLLLLVSTFCVIYCLIVLSDYMII